jgi:hypothetical protein
MTTNDPSRLRNLALKVLKRKLDSALDTSWTAAEIGARKVSNGENPVWTAFHQINQEDKSTVQSSSALGVGQLDSARSGTSGIGRSVGQATTNDIPLPEPYRQSFMALEAQCPDGIEAAAWRRAVKDARAFLATWGEQAVALGWTSEDLFGLHQPAPRPSPTYRRLSRHDATGLVWLLDGRRVVALTEDAATIATPNGGHLTFRRRVAT